MGDKLEQVHEFEKVFKFFGNDGNGEIQKE